MLIPHDCEDGFLGASQRSRSTTSRTRASTRDAKIFTALERSGVFVQRVIFGDLTDTGSSRPRGFRTKFRQSLVGVAVDDGLVGALESGRARVVAAVGRFEATDIFLADHLEAPNLANMEVLGRPALPEVDLPPTSPPVLGGRPRPSRGRAILVAHRMRPLRETLFV